MVRECEWDDGVSSFTILYQLSPHTADASVQYHHHRVSMHALLQQIVTLQFNAMVKISRDNSMIEVEIDLE